jgi:hypothetical protein
MAMLSDFMLQAGLRRDSFTIFIQKVRGWRNAVTSLLNMLQRFRVGAK